MAITRDKLGRGGREMRRGFQKGDAPMKCLKIQNSPFERFSFPGDLSLQIINNM
jgi:hypothetical protein